ncbi:hypothetical protein Mapa_016622 [Marchantia paleacea]|nr:hypothetical protein Mapa_016622 [Marchantia paleacea]
MGERDDLRQSLLDPEEGQRPDGPDGDSSGLSEQFARVADAWRKQKQSRWLQLGTSTAELEERRAPWRKELGEALEATPSHVVIVVLLLVDLLATVVDILKTVHNKTHDLSTCTAYLQECQCVQDFEKTESWEFLYWISISILSILAVNVVGLLVAFGTAFFRHPGYVLDLVVVGTALLLEIFLDSDTVGLLIVLTLWRIVRVAHGIFEVTDEAWEKEIETFKDQLKDADSKHYADQELLRQKDQRIAELSGQRNGQEYQYY